MAMEPLAAPSGFAPADFSAGFLDLSGPYFLRDDGPATILGLHVQERHGNYIGVAHGGLLATFADVALSFQVHASETPRLKVATNTLTTNFIAGRYVDRLVRVGAEWRIIARTGIYDWREFREIGAASLSNVPPAARGAHDATDPAWPVGTAWR